MKVANMFNALQTAAQGLLSSASQTALSASHIVTAAAAPFRSDIVEVSDINRGNNAYKRSVNTRQNYNALPSHLSGRSGSILTPHAELDPEQQNSSYSLVDETVRLQMAVHAYKTNTLVIRTLDKTIGSFLEKIA